MNKKEIEPKKEIWTAWSRTKTKGRTTFFQVEWKNEEKCWDFVPNTNSSYLLASIQ